MALSGKRILSTDPLTGLITYHQYDDDTDQTIISYDAPSAPVIDPNNPGGIPGGNPGGNPNPNPSQGQGGGGGGGGVVPTTTEPRRR